MSLIHIYLTKTIALFIIGCAMVLSTILYFTNIVLGYLYGYITFNIFGIDMLWVEPTIDYLTDIQVILIIFSLFVLFYINYLIIKAFDRNFYWLCYEIFYRIKNRN